MTFAQLHVGRDEPILDPDLPIIDAHHHLFLRPAIRYLFDDYLADIRSGHRVVASVYMEANSFARPDGPEALRPLGEVEFANGAGAMGASGLYGEARVCAGIVGYADLRLGDAVGRVLDAALALAPDRYRGVRQIANDHPDEAPYRYMPNPPPRGLLRHPAVRDGLRQLAARGLSFDAALFHHQLPDLAALADALPDLSIVINHCGHTVAMDLDADGRAAVFAEWREAMREIARRPNVTCKIGGLGLPFWGFGLESRTDPIGYEELAAIWKPHVETTVELFGPERCMMESNYPIDGRAAGFVPLWNALKHIVRGATPAEKAALFHGTAARVYRLAVPGL